MVTKNEENVKQKLQATNKPNDIPKTRNDVKKPKKDLRPQTQDVLNTKGLEWDDLIDNENLLMGLIEKGWERPSPVQEETLPQALAKKNIIAKAKNGTGKTGAFIIPILDQLDTKKEVVQALILVPTRELALQTSQTVKEVGKYMDVKCMVSTGGTQFKEDIYRINQGVHIVVGTPGRILDLVQRKVMKMDNCNIITLDEADKLLSQNFQQVMDQILEFANKNIQLLLMSATFPVYIKEFKEKYLKSCQVINLVDQLTLHGITQYYVYLEEQNKVDVLRYIFNKLNINQCIIFCRSTRRVELLTKKISEFGFSCFFIHSQMEQSERNKVFHGFRNQSGRVLVSSDLCTRGIDIQTVNVVINFDYPKTAETYLHRIGRSGRFGHLGLAINFITDVDKESAVKIETQLNIDTQKLPDEVDSSLY